jgi:heparan-alpha-glucosaminide N-acetyltransferase
MSFVLLLLAGILCGFSQNEGVFPVNKNLWSTSFIFVTAGFGLIMLSITYVAVDITKIWSGAPFRYLGLNSILIYVAHELLWRHFPFSYLTELSDHAKYLQCCIIGVSCWTLVAFYCYKIKFFVKI